MTKPPAIKTIVTETQTQRIELDTDAIESILHNVYAKPGWSVSYDWNVGQWVSLTIVRRRETRRSVDMDEPLADTGA